MLVHTGTNRLDEAGLYLSTFKQYEHKSPDMIKERVDKTYDAILRTALTSISKVNKTDVETLRTSLGVRNIRSLFRKGAEVGSQSFANISKTSAERLQALPGFGQVKVKKIKEAFDSPFRYTVKSKVHGTQSNFLNVNKSGLGELALLSKHLTQRADKPSSSRSTISSFASN